MNYTKQYYFPTPIYFLEKQEWVESLNKASDKFVNEARDLNKQFFINGKDLGLVHHSSALLIDNRFDEFMKFICDNAFLMLAEQGYDINLYSLAVQECWVQEFSKDGGGHHNSHIHSNSHISGFYFLKCSDKTSYPVFHDSRLNKKMIQLKEKDQTKITESSELINIPVKPGMFIFFPSYAEHQFVMDSGTDPFRFIHFNLQAIPKDYLKIENNKRI
jgi:uncharacterized protein (TIGR02466 family)